MSEQKPLRVRVAEALEVAGRLCKSMGCDCEGNGDIQVPTFRSEHAPDCDGSSCTYCPVQAEDFEVQGCQRYDEIAHALDAFSETRAAEAVARERDATFKAVNEALGACTDRDMGIVALEAIAARREGGK